MKKTLSILMALILSLCLVFAACENEPSQSEDNGENDIFVKPVDTDLEFWITENVEGVDFSGHDEITGWFGAREYLGSGYEKLTDEYGRDSKPTYYVSYLVTAYPDYADGGEYITKIGITDPDIDVFGINVNSTIADFDAVFEAMGFTLSDADGGSAYTVRVAQKDGISFALTQGKDGAQNIIPELTVRAEVTNRDGIEY